MKNLIFILALMFGEPATSQNLTQHFRYDFELTAYMQFEALPKETKALETHILWHAIRDSRFLLMYLEEVQTESDFEGGIGKENWDDTLLFDIKTHKLYMFNSKKCYQFEKRLFPLNAEGKYISADTVLDCPVSVPRLATPTPTLMVGNRGIGVYKTKRFTFLYRDAKKSEVDLNSYYEKYKGFPFTAGKPPFVY